MTDAETPEQVWFINRCVRVAEIAAHRALLMELVAGSGEVYAPWVPAGMWALLKRLGYVRPFENEGVDIFWRKEKKAAGNAPTTPGAIFAAAMETIQDEEIRAAVLSAWAEVNL